MEQLHYLERVELFLLSPNLAGAHLDSDPKMRELRSCTRRAA